MTTYYRTTDGALVELSLAQLNALAPSKRETLKVYSIDPQPVPAAGQYVAAGPVVVEGDAARKTWTLQAMDAGEIAAQQFAVAREADLAQIKLIYAALKNGTGTNAERITRCERVLARLLKDIFGGDPA